MTSKNIFLNPKMGSDLLFIAAGEKVTFHVLAFSVCLCYLLRDPSVSLLQYTQKSVTKLFRLADIPLQTICGI